VLESDKDNVGGLVGLDALKTHVGDEEVDVVKDVIVADGFGERT